MSANENIKIKIKTKTFVKLLNLLRLRMNIV